MSCCSSSFLQEKKRLASFDAAYERLENIAERIKTGPGATSDKDRKLNLESVIGILEAAFTPGDVSAEVYGHPSNIDFENLVRQSPLEHGAFEFKQGFVSLADSREFDTESFSKIINTICAIANCEPKISGHIFIGICDKKSDALRVAEIDHIEPLELDRRYIVGISREAKVEGKTLEKYVNCIRDKIEKSKLSEPLKGSVLNTMSVINYYGREILHIGVPMQK